MPVANCYSETPNTHVENYGHYNHYEMFYGLYEYIEYVDDIVIIWNENNDINENDN